MLELVKGILPAVLYTWAYLADDSNWRSFREEDFASNEGKFKELQQFMAYEKNIVFIIKWNQMENRTFDCGLNKYSKVSSKVFRKLMLGLTVPQLPADDYNVMESSVKNVEILPHEFDWSEQGAVTSVKDQDMCASSYAFAIAGALEAFLPLWLEQDIIELSPQNMIDCIFHRGNVGCKGGFIDATYKFVKKNKGISSLEDYPYQARVGECETAHKKYAPIGGFAILPYGNEDGLQKILYFHGPVVVGIDASLRSLQLYRRGIYYDPECNGEHLNHAMLLVGWGVEDGVDFWILKNSWGKTWGEQGYLRLIRGINHCGIANYASVPTTKKISR